MRKIIIGMFSCLIIGAMVAPGSFGLLGEFFQARYDAMALSHCVEAGGHLIEECEDIRK